MNISFNSDIVLNLFKPKISKLLKATGSVPTFIINDINQIFQFLTQESNNDFDIIHLTNEFFLQEGEITELSIKKNNQFFELLEAKATNSSATLILNNVPIQNNQFSSNNVIKMARYFNHINDRIYQLTEDHRNVKFIDLQSLFIKRGFDNLFNLKNKFIFTMPYTKEGVTEISKLYADLILREKQARKKVCILDADNTLWKGVIGEDGVEGIQLNSDYPNNIYKMFQKQLLDLKKTGIVLCLCTKNNESDVIDFFNQKEMPLSLDDFVIVKSNWNLKSENIKEIATELNLGLSSMFFIDDNAFEIGQVKDALQDVDCYQFDTNNYETNLNLLKSIKGIYSDYLSKEDLVKTELYQAENKRKSVQTNSGSVEDYIKSLNIKLKISLNDENNIPRISQLTNKTNQFNLTTKRYSESDIKIFMKNHHVYSCQLEDDFGDMGIIGVVIVKEDKIDSFLMSCRALGRKVENDLLAATIENHGMSLNASYFKTAKNAQVKTFYDNYATEISVLSDEKVAYKLKNQIAYSGLVTIEKNEYGH